MNLIPGWVKVLVLAGLAVLVLAAFNAWRHSLIAEGYAAGEMHERGLWLVQERKRQDDEAAERARLDRQKEESDRETRRLNELAQASRAAADAAAGQLRHALAAAVDAAKRPGAAPVGQRPAAESALDLLSDLFSRADEEAGILADYADRARIAGQQCERDYDALRAKP